MVDGLLELDGIDKGKFDGSLDGTANGTDDGLLDVIDMVDGIHGSWYS
jgi:hypothetical protein